MQKSFRFHLLFCVVMWLASIEILAQNANDSMFRVNQFPEDGLLLNSHWKFYPKDDFIYAGYEYNGQDGISLNPSQLLDRLPDVQHAGLGWFRLTMQVDSSLLNKTIGMLLSLFGAAEIYLNGKKIYAFGTVNSNYKDEKTEVIYGKALSITLGNYTKQVLAVRYSHHQRNRYIKTAVIPPCLQIVFQPLNQSIDRYAVLVKRAYQFIGIALTIELASALLTLFFFFSFRDRKEYLYFGLYFAFNFFGVVVQSDLSGVGKETFISINEFAIIQVLIYTFLIIGSLFHLNAMYALLKLKRTKFYWFLFAYAMLSVITLPFVPGIGGMLPELFFLLACVELLRQYYKAIRRNFAGAWILFLSILLCLLLLAALVTVNYQNDSGMIVVFTALTLLTPALGIVMFLAVDFARTSSSLKARITEVENLSEKSLAQERDKQEILAAQKDKLEEEVQHRTAELTQSLTDLKSAQAQLIQSEKMASLGELTAGIAHEIQNPLNFVNNFSEVNKELLDELKEALNKNAKDETLVIVSSIQENLDKIDFHGKRADSIVKGMLQHSRKSTGVKEETDINALADEYLRLSYYGFRAKDQNFTCKYITQFDAGINCIKLIPQDIGRVFMNLFNNAFYAVNQKQVNNPSFEPIVTVSTKRKNDKVEISIKDNGTGMPKNIIDKIFQPFFTTKPTGEGTGLGLSLSYEIITKVHGGEIKVESREGEGTEFLIQLPMETDIDK